MNQNMGNLGRKSAAEEEPSGRQRGQGRWPEVRVVAEHSEEPRERCTWKLADVYTSRRADRYRSLNQNGDRVIDVIRDGTPPPCKLLPSLLLLVANQTKNRRLV
jgi:hypothetical protein